MNSRGYSFCGYDGVCYYNSKTTSYGAPGFGKDDVIGVLLDLDKGFINYFRNGSALGNAPFASKVKGPVRAAVTLVAIGDRVTLDPTAKCSLAE